MNGKRARNHFAENGYLCAESVLLAGAEALGFHNPAIPAMATGFCSGTSRTKGPCGALQGAILLINLKHGRSTSEEDLDYCYSLVQELTEWFESNFGSNNCFDLTGCDFSTPEGQLRFRELDQKSKVCFPIVEAVTDFTINLLK